MGRSADRSGRFRLWGSQGGGLKHRGNTVSERHILHVVGRLAREHVIRFPSTDTDRKICRGDGHGPLLLRPCTRTCKGCKAQSQVCISNGKGTGRSGWYKSFGAVQRSRGSKRGYETLVTVTWLQRRNSMVVSFLPIGCVGDP